MIKGNSFIDISKVCACVRVRVCACVCVCVWGGGGVELKLGSFIPNEPIIYGSSSFHTVNRARVERIKACDLFHVSPCEILNWAHASLNSACANLFLSARQNS